MIQLNTAPIGTVISFYLSQGRRWSERKIISSADIINSDNIEKVSATIIGKYWDDTDRIGPAVSVFLGWKRNEIYIKDYFETNLEGKQLLTDFVRGWLGQDNYEFCENLDEYVRAQWARGIEDTILVEPVGNIIQPEYVSSSMHYINAQDIRPGDVIAYIRVGNLYHAFVEDISEDENHAGASVVLIEGKIYCNGGFKTKHQLLIDASNKILLINRVEK